jgi:hypothetical protein
MVPAPAGEVQLLQAAFSFEPTGSAPILHLVTVKPLDPSSFEVQLWQSADKGGSWQELLSISPVRTPAAALLAGSPLFLALQNEVIKLVKAPDGWQLEGNRSFLPDDLYITALAASLADGVDPTLFAATNRGLFYSTDRDVHWRPLGQGLEGRAVVALLIPPRQQRIGAVTLGGEIWWLE